jgi:hypothetical protein
MSKGTTREHHERYDSRLAGMPRFIEASIQIVCGADKCQMGESLREISQMFPM